MGTNYKERLRRWGRDPEREQKEFLAKLRVASSKTSSEHGVMRMRTLGLNSWFGLGFGLRWTRPGAPVRRRRLRDEP